MVFRVMYQLGDHGLNQVLILIDGIKMNDSQTEHYNMDLPINVEDIERIEIIKGGASSIIRFKRICWSYKHYYKA